MPNNITKICLFIIIGSLFYAGPVTGAAAISTIRPGNTVFIGEQGLDITPALDGDTQIGWWASGASITTSSPDYPVVASSPTSFSVSQNIFGSRTGVWYHLNPSGRANGSVFTVADPQLDIRVEDTTVSVDVTDKWVSTEDEIRFRIETNLVSITQRTGVASTPITIKVQSPSGGIYTSLINNAGTTTSIVDYAVSTSPQYTNPIWGTINRDTYPPGTYTIWAECNVNSMKDNYGVAGKAISRTVSLLNQDKNPLISVNIPTTNPPATQTTTKSPSSSTTVPPTSTTSITPLPTTAAPSSFPASPSPAATPQNYAPSPTQTKATGFEATLAGAAIILGLIFYLKKD